MGLGKDEKSKRVLRGAKTVFFLLTMFASLLILSAPLLLIIADTLLPSALLSASLPPSLSLLTISSHFNNYDFRYSLIDIPLISIIRSAVIFCVYCFCDGPRLSRGPYMGITTLCCLLSLVFVSLKASYVFGAASREGSEGCVRAMEVALFMSSLVFAVGHIVVAYRTCCKERRKLLIYKIDIEAISACQKGFPTYKQLLQEVRVK